MIQERARRTRRRLLDATVAVLVERGFAGTTTTEVVKRAEVSQGALFKHFESKAALMRATVDHLFDQLLDDYRKLVVDLARTERLVDDAVDVLVTMFQTDRMKAVLTLYGAAHHDASLRDALVPAVERHRANIRAVARELFGDVANDSTLDALVRGAMATMHGVALLSPISGGEPMAIGFLRAAIRAALEGDES